MKVKLPLTGHTVDVQDYIPQSVVEAVEAVLLGGVKMADNSWDRVGMEDVMRSYPKLYDAIQKEKNEERKEILTMEAKKRVAATDPDKGGLTAAEYNVSERVEVVHMITAVKLKDGKDLDVSNIDKLTVWVLALPAPDYRRLKKAVAEVDATMRKNLELAGEV